jgi:hypothetical protein
VVEVRSHAVGEGHSGPLTATRSRGVRRGPRPAGRQ